MIRAVCKDDAAAICGIYNHYIENTVITFEETSVTAEEMECRINEVTDSLPWIVYEEDGRIAGYAYASKWKGRCAYRYSVESTVYLVPGDRGRGIGSELYKSLIDELKLKNMHAVLAGIALPNEGSRRLHEKFGFEKTAHFSEVGFKFNRWIDVGYWELRLG